MTSGNFWRLALAAPGAFGPSYMGSTGRQGPACIHRAPSTSARVEEALVVAREAATISTAMKKRSHPTS